MVYFVENAFLLDFNALLLICPCVEGHVVYLASIISVTKPAFSLKSKSYAVLC